MPDLKEAHEKALIKAVSFRFGEPGATGPACGQHHRSIERAIKKYLASMVEQGWVLVPKEATWKMRVEAVNDDECKFKWQEDVAGHWWRTMISARPTLEGEE